jgi:hypothetical protein
MNSAVDWVLAMLADGHAIMRVEASAATCAQLVASGLLPTATMLPERVAGRVVVTVQDGTEYAAIASQ